MLNPVTVDLPTVAADDPRVGHLIGLSSEPPTVVIVGFPSDRGVTLNGGRAGASQGPAAIRRALYRMTPGSAGFVDLYPHVTDLGDVQVTGDVAADQAQLAEALSRYVESGTVCIVLGGGHETAYGHYLGYVANDMAPGIINWDAHADVRQPADAGPTSGSSFYQAMFHETHPSPSYTVAGLLPHSVSDTHVKLLREHECERLWKAHVDQSAIDDLYAAVTERTMVSFDLDAIDQSSAPGVSAPAVGGLGIDLWFHAAYGAGLCSPVSSIDICELNPAFDQDDRTARVAALTIWHFLSGLATRLGIQRFIRRR